VVLDCDSVAIDCSDAEELLSERGEPKFVEAAQSVGRTVSLNILKSDPA